MEKLVPKLRFPEFEGNWERKKLSEVSKNAMYGMNSSAIEFDGINKYIRITDIDEDTRSYIPSPLTSPDGIIEEKYKLKANDIVFARTGASVGKSYIYKESDGNLFFAGFLIKFNINRANSKFVFYETLRYNYDKWVKTVSMRSGQPGINSEEYKEFNLTLPQSEEQQKIATFLTSVDERLTLLAQQKEKLELYKKGVMQQIFSQKLRFKDENGKEYPDWEEKKLGDLFNFLRGSSLSKNDLKLDGKNLCIHYGELFTIHNEEIKYILSRTDISGTLSKSGDILMPSSDVTPNGLATASAIFHENVIIGGDINILRPSKSLNSLYFSYYLNFSKKEIIKLVTGTTVKHIYNKDVKLLKLKVSKSLEEQQKIASFLSAIDVQIEGVNKKIAQTKTFKKGLLQQLFV